MQLIRTDLSKGEFSPSGITTAACFRRFYYQKVLGLKPKTTPAALSFGTAIHSAVEMFYSMTSGMDKPTQEQKVEIKIAVVQEFARSWTESGNAGDIKRNLETGVMIMNNYVDKYIHDTSKFELEDIETHQWVAMPNGTMMLVIMDRVLRESNMIVLVDTKTTSGSISPYYFRGFENHLATTLYAYTVEQLLGRCDYVMIDAIKVPPPPINSKAEPFGRAPFMRTKLQMDDAINTYCSVSDYIMSVLKRPREEWATRFYANMSECSAYGGCQYLDICKHGLTHPTVKINFDIETPKWVKDSDVG
jgi:hypothetical protein